MFQKKIFIVLVALLGMSQCQKQKLGVWEDGTAVYRENTGTGKVNGLVKNKASGNSLNDVRVVSLVRGQKIETRTDANGEFDLELLGIRRGEGYNIHFIKDGFISITRAGIFRLPNLRLELGEIQMTPLNSQENPS